MQDSSEEKKRNEKRNYTIHAHVDERAR